MFEFYDNEIDEIEERRRRLRRRGRELSREEINRMVDETAAKLELAPPQFGPSDGMTNEEVNKLFDSISTLGKFTPPECRPQG
jgi:hypothetical protein